jgi:putative salt-induced outer membrane protein YdiY
MLSVITTYSPRINKKRTMMNITKFLYVLGVTFGIAGFAHSGQIVLNNGDIVKGTVLSKTETHVLWKSDSFGGLNIPLSQVASIDNSGAEATLPSTADDKISLTGNVGLSGSYLAGNQERENLELDVGFTLQDGNAKHKAELNYDAIGQNNEPTEYDYGITYEVDWSINNGWYWNTNASFSVDDKRQIDQSNSLGTSMGYQFWGNDKGSLSSNVGLKWISDKSFYSGTDERLAWAWSSDYQKFLFSGTSLSYSHQLNVSTEDTKNTQLSIDVGLSIPVNDKVDTTISLDWSYDNQPEEGVEQIDRKVNFGINYKW